MERISAPRTALAYLRDAEAVEAFRQGRQLTLGLIENWLNDGRLRPQTIKRRESGLRAWLGFLGAHGDDVALRLSQVMRAYRVAKGPRQADRRPVRPVTTEEYNKVADSDNVPHWGKALAALLWSSGARISEVLGDPLASLPILPLTVADGLTLAERGWVETKGKGGKRRTIVLATPARRILAEWVGGKELSAPLFPSPNNPMRPITPQAVRALLRQIGLRHGPHAFRHAFRARLRRAGVAEQVVATMLGHGPRNVTDAYGTPDVSEMLLAVEKLAEAEVGAQ
jgi:integrase